MSETKTIDNYQCFYSNGLLYIVVPVHEQEQDEIVERYYMSKYLHKRGEKYIPRYVKRKDGYYISKWREQYFLLVKLTSWRNEPYRNTAKKLAYFHMRGSEFPQVNQLSRYGEWNTYWETRLEQLENFWRSLVYQKPENEFEKMFIESFPYYAGLTENAIQFYVDTLQDVQPSIQDVGTITHIRFRPETWSNHFVWKNPFEWVFDHPSRDLAEWSRHLYLEKPQTYTYQLQLYFQNYQSVYNLSPYFLRLLFSRLLFPLHYFECMEEYMVNRTNERSHFLKNKLKYFLENSEGYEYFLTTFFEKLQIPTRTYQIPPIEWLRK